MKEERRLLGIGFLFFGILFWMGSVTFGYDSRPISQSRPGLGKMFHYTAKQFGISIFRASIGIENGSSEQKRGLHQVQARVESVNLGFLLRMNNRFTSVMDAETGQPIQYIKEIDQEGLFAPRKKYSETFTFDSVRQKVTVERKGVEEKKEIFLPSGTYDPLSMFARYYLKEDLYPGQDVRVSVFDGVRLRQLVFHLEKERVRSNLLGEVETVRLESTTSFSSFGDKEGIIRIWYTADGKKNPVSLELDLPLGSIKFELVGIDES